MDQVEFLSSEDIKNKFSNIHPSALVAVGAEIDPSVFVGAHASIGPNVKLDKSVKVHQGAIVTGDTSVGEGTEIHPYATIGTAPQDLKYGGEKTSLRIGKFNQLREYVNISLGTVTGNKETIVGDHNLVMAYSHIAHDCIVGNRVIVANGVQIAGHVEVGDHAVFGGLAGIHQFTIIGTYAMVGAGAIIVKDVVPFSMVQGDRAKPIGLNVVGLRRSDFSKDEVSDIKAIYRTIYNSGKTIEEATEAIRSSDSSQKVKDIYADFLSRSNRGVVR